MCVRSSGHSKDATSSGIANWTCLISNVTPDIGSMSRHKEAKLGTRANLNSIKAMVGVVLRETDEEVQWLLKYQLMEDVALYYAPPEVTKALEELTLT
jgi:hypothetical protein